MMGFKNIRIHVASWLFGLGILIAPEEYLLVLMREIKASDWTGKL